MFEGPVADGLRAVIVMTPARLNGSWHRCRAGLDDPVMVQQGLPQQGCRHTKGDSLPTVALNISGPGRRTDHYQRESANQHSNDKAFCSHDVPPFVMRFISLDTG
jgi:hypothetical protein